MIELNKIYNKDCLEGMKRIPDGIVDCIVTDIPYNECNRTDNGLRNLDKDKADIGCFDITEPTYMLCNKTRGSIYMFCGFNQVSNIRMAMTAKGLSTRIIVWEKTNPSPMNGSAIWLSGIELCVFGKKPGAPFNLHCKNTVLRFPCGTNKIHPTQNPVELMRQLVLASSQIGGVVFDPFMGSGTTAIACIREKRNFIGFEKSEEYWRKSMERIRNELSQQTLF